MSRNHEPSTTDCDRFQRRMNSLLDCRADLQNDEQLQQHAGQCDACRESLLCWSEVDRLVLQPVSPANETRSSHAPKPIGVRTRFAVSIAASLMLIATVGRFIVRSSQPEDRVSVSTEFIESSPPTGSLPPSGNQDSVLLADSALEGAGQASMDADWNSGTLWNAVTDDQWVRQTLPAVNSVRRGVAPIGRSMRQAIAILMIQGQGGSIPSPADTPNLQQPSFDEHTSKIERVRVFTTMV